MFWIGIGIGIKIGIEIGIVSRGCDGYYYYQCWNTVLALVR